MEAPFAGDTGGRLAGPFDPPLSIPLARLAAFEDRTALRDPKARTSTPSLVLARGALEVRGPFQLRRTAHATRARGRNFVLATGDSNPIHTDGFVVPGAWTASQMVAPLEVLLPRLALTSLRVSFTGVAWYEHPVRLVLKITPSSEDGTISVEAVAHQSDREVARGDMTGRILPEAPCLELAERKVDLAWRARVDAFFRSLGIAPASYFEKGWGAGVNEPKANSPHAKSERRDLSYPYAFLASLPSGEMVERLSGQGGILNRLTLEFDAAKLPIAGPPEVSLELPERLRKSFNKVLTRIKEGVLTAARGAALILPRSEAPPDVLSQLEEKPKQS